MSDAIEGRVAAALERRAAAAEVTEPTEALARQRTADVVDFREGRVAPRRRLALAAAVFVLLVGAVGVSVAIRDRSDPVPATPTPSTTSHPFEVTAPPRGYDLVSAGVGTVPPTFGSDIETSLEAFTLLTEDGTPDGPGAVAVSYLRQPGEEVLGAAVADRPGMIAEPGQDGGSGGDRGDTYVSGPAGAELLRTLDPSGVSVRVSSAGARSLAELAAIADAVALPTSDERLRAPDLGEGLGALRVAGHVDASVIAAQWPLEYVQQDLGPEGAHVALYVTPNDRQRVVVRTLPGTAADLDAIGRHPWLDPRRVGTVEVAGRVGILLTCGDWCRAIATTTDDGDLLLVSSTAHDHRALTAIAASVEPVDAARWNEIADEASDGP